MSSAGSVSSNSGGPRQRTKMKTTTIISNDGAMVVNQPEPTYAVRGTEAVDVTRAPLSRQLAERCGAKMQEAADDLVKLYKRISLDDDLDDTLRGELLSQLTAGASLTAGTLRLVTGLEPSQGEIPHTMKQPMVSSPLGLASNTPHTPDQSSLSANPYFQHMIQNYSNMMRGGQSGANPPHPHGPSNPPPSSK